MDDIAKTTGVEDTIGEMLEERGKRYGIFLRQAAFAVQLKEVIRRHPEYSGMSSDKKEALDMILHKIARILNGDSDYVDSWIDIAGYAKLVADNLNGNYR